MASNTSDNRDHPLSTGTGRGHPERDRRRSAKRRVGHWDSEQGYARYRAEYDAAFAEFPEPADTFSVGTDFGNVRVYRFEGEDREGHPLLLLPGKASGSPVWADNVPYLLELGDVYVLDLLGEPGLSVQQRPITTDEEQAAWLHQTVQQLPPDAFHLVGLSFGGWNAVNLVLHNPAGIASITLLDSSLTSRFPLEFYLRSIPATVPWLPKRWRDSFNSYLAGGFPAEDVPVARMIEAGMHHFKIRLPQPSRFTEEQLATIDLPALIIIGGNSPIHKPSAAAELARSFPNGTVNVYVGASHAVNGEEPERIAHDIAELIDATARRA